MASVRSKSRLVTLMTVAPRSASICGPNGPAMASPKSRTSVPARGAAGIGASSPAATASRRVQVACRSAGSVSVAVRGRMGGFGDSIERVHVPDLPDRAVLGVVELDDHALVLEGRVEQRLPRATGSAAERCSPTSTARSTPPAGGWRWRAPYRRGRRPGRAPAIRSHHHRRRRGRSSAAAGAAIPAALACRKACSIGAHWCSHLPSPAWKIPFGARRSKYQRR